MNEVLKGSWLIEYNHHHHHHHYNNNNDGQFSCEAAVSDAGVGRPVIEIDEKSLEEEGGGSFLHASDVRKTVSFTWSGEGSKDTYLGGKQQHFITIDGDATENSSAQPYEREKDFALSTSVAPRGPYQRPARIIQSPDWLPDGWATEVRIREWGNTAGTKDKYYVNPTNGRRFRSKKEVMEYLQTGNLSRWKRKAKAAELGSYSVTASVAQETCPSPEPASNLVKSSSHFASPPKQAPALLPNWSIPPLARGPSKYVEDAVSVPYKTSGFGNFCSAGSWHSSNQHNVFDKKQPYRRSDHIPQLPMKMGIVPHVAMRPHPLEVIDLEAIPITTLSIETRPFAENRSRLNPPKELFLPYAETKGLEAKYFSSQLQRPNRDIQHTPNQQKHLHSGVNILGEMTHNIVEASCQVPKLGVLYGSNSYLEDSSQGASTCVGDTVHTNLGRDSLGAFQTTSSFYNKKSLHVSRISPLPGLGSSVGGSTTPLLWQYQMLLPSFAGNSALAQTFCRPDENGSMVGTKTYERVQLLNSKQLVEKENTSGSFFPDTKQTPLSSPLGVKKLQKLRRHQEKKQLELLGRKLCRQGLAFVHNELSTQLCEKQK